jgi:hypothetical protein
LSSPDHPDLSRFWAIQAFKETLSNLSGREATLIVALDLQSLMPELMGALPLIEISPFGPLAETAAEPERIQESPVTRAKAMDFAARKPDPSPGDDATALMAGQKRDDVRAGATRGREPADPPVFSLARNRSAARHKQPTSAARQSDANPTGMAEAQSSNEGPSKPTGPRLSTDDLLSTTGSQAQPIRQQEDHRRFQKRIAGQTEAANRSDEPMSLIGRLVDEILQKASAPAHPGPARPGVDAAAPEGAPGSDAPRFDWPSPAASPRGSSTHDRAVEQALPATGALSRFESLAEELTRGWADAQLPASLVGQSPEQTRAMTGADDQGGAVERFNQGRAGLSPREATPEPPAAHVSPWPQSFVKDQAEARRPLALSQSDAETLASLVNEALYEQARRHGVDFS